MVKKLVSIFVVVMIVCAIALVPAYAQTTPIRSIDIEPNGNPICPLCYEGYLLHTHQYSLWYRTGDQRLCIHFPFGVDIKERRDVTTTYHCTVCEYGYTEYTFEIRWICEGHF
jgi:hypothetical protein